MSPLLHTAAALLASALLAAALPQPPSYLNHNNIPTHNNQCAEFDLPIAVQTTALDFHLPPVTNACEATQWAVSASTWSKTAPPPTNVSIDQTFSIHGKLCIPRQGSKKQILHLATHGVAFDSRYWDVPIDPAQYSYVYNALREGYSVLTYDRLTTGQSEKPDGYLTAQGIVEVEVLRGLTELVRSGEIFDHVDGLEEQGFESIIHVGHSFGSYVINVLLALYGSISDAAILTGFIFTEHAALPLTSLGLDFAATNDPKFADRPDAYVVPARDIDVQTGFFSALANTTLNIGGFDPALLELANATKQPGALAEFASLGILEFNYGPATEFTGPVQFMEAEFDYVLCGGDCHDWNQTMIDLVYAAASDVEIYLQPGTGHGLTCHRNASVGYQATFDFLDRNGL